MQKLHGGYKFEIIVITVGAMGAVPVPLEGSLKKLFPENENIELLIQCIQKAAILGILKVCKTALGMRSSYILEQKELTKMRLKCEYNFEV